MQKKSLALIILGLLVFASMALMPSIGLAQDNNWGVYLFNGSSGELVRVNGDGTQAVSGLGLGQGEFAGSSDMAFTRDGSRLAFCTTTYPQAVDANSTALPTAKFYLRDIAAQNYLLNLDLGNAIGCRTGHAAFNSDDTQVAVSRINYYPGDPAADTSKPSWQILVMDIAGSMTVKELNAASPSVATYEGLTKGAILPYVVYFAGNQLIFAEVPYGIGGGAEWNAYLWDMDADTVEMVPRWGNIGLDTLPSSGEIVWVTKDANLPAGIPGGPVPDNNIVKYADKTGTEHTIFTSPDWVVLDAKFINGGQQVAIQLLSSFDQNNPNQLQTIKWVALDRAGNLTDLLSSVGGSPVVAAAPNGYVALDQQQTFDANGTGQSQFKLTYNAAGQSKELWASTVGFDYWELAWATPLTVTGDITPFPAVG
ncbi:MAG: hypothetical protein ABI690_10405 [Chloroflexota bacterium]